MTTPTLSFVRGFVTLMMGLAALAAAAQTQDPKPRLSAPLVHVDAYPVTADGQIVNDLTVDDFEVREDNVVQTIESLERVAVDQPRPSGAAAPAAPAQGPRLAAGERTRIVVVFLDTYHTDTVAVRALHTPLIRLLESALGPDDVIAVMTPEMSARDITFNRKSAGVEPALARMAEYSRRDEARLRDADEERYLTCFPEDGRATCGESASSSYAGVARELASRRREQQVMAALTDLSRTLEGVNDARKGGARHLARLGALSREPEAGTARQLRKPLDARSPGRPAAGPLRRRRVARLPTGWTRRSVRPTGEGSRPSTCSTTSSG